uniref:Col_cuticle_N domain-containing protein n=1 Tax=Rhabditophanes sp. KR3021 TaxID=114890 RepID=A0AC35UHB1_9BILA
MASQNQYFTPNSDQMTSIILPTIVFFIIVVVSMLYGISKCKQYEVDKIVEMRRTRRVIQRITARLREKNFKTIETVTTITDVAPPLYNGTTPTAAGVSPPPSYAEVVLDRYYKSQNLQLTNCKLTNNRKTKQYLLKLF